MARSEMTSDDLKGMEDDFAFIVERIRRARAVMDGEEPRLPALLTHSLSIRNTYIPHIMQWAGSLELDAMTQGRAFRNGVKSRAEFNKEHSERRKQREAERSPVVPAVALPRPAVAAFFVALPIVPSTARGGRLADSGATIGPRRGACVYIRAGTNGCQDRALHFV